MIKKISNNKVVELLRMEISVLETIKKCEIGYFGQANCESKYNIIKLIIQVLIEDGHREPRRRQIFYLWNIRQQTGLETIQELLRAAENGEILQLSNDYYEQ